METLKILVLSCPYSTDGPYLVSRDKTEPGPLFLKELSNYTVRHVNAVCVHILRSIFAIMMNEMPITHYQLYNLPQGSEQLPSQA